MSVILKIDGYRLNRDYDWLAREMLKRSLICIVDYGTDCRDVAHTIWYSGGESGGVWQLSARGQCYVYATSVEDFVRQCRQANVEVVLPQQPIEEGQ